MQHQIVPNFGGIDLVPAVSDDLHQANRRRAGVCDGPGSCQHRDVEAESDVLLSGLVYTFNVIGLGLVRHQFWMFLYHQYKAGLALESVHVYG